MQYQQLTPYKDEQSTLKEKKKKDSNPGKNGCNITKNDCL